MRSMMVGHPGLFEDSRLGSADGSLIASQMGQSMNSMLIQNAGSMAKARRCILSDIIFECQSDRFNVNENFGQTDVEHFINTGSKERKKSHIEHLRKRMERNLEPPGPLKPSELAVTMKPSKAPKFRRGSGAPLEVDHEYFDKQLRALQERNDGDKMLPE